MVAIADANRHSYTGRWSSKTAMVQRPMKQDLNAEEEELVSSSERERERARASFGSAGGRSASSSRAERRCRKRAECVSHESAAEVQRKVVSISRKANGDPK